MAADKDSSVADTLTSKPEAGAAAEPRRPIVERYERQGLIARGGQAEVYVAFDHELGREVAFKVPRADASGQVEKEAEARFLREARITARLDHPNVITVHEIGRALDGRLFCAMRLVLGEDHGAPRSFGQALREAPTLQARLALLPRFLDVCNGVAHAHARGVVHRDLKPDNVVLGGLGETVVLDWGLARDRSGADVAPAGGRHEALQTVDGQVFGTPLYMSPEQANGQRDLVDERSDVWSLGVMLFEILTGRTPFSGDTPLAVVLAVRSAPVPAPHRLAPEAPRALAAVVERALARDPAARYPTAAAMARDVRAFLEHRQVGVYDYSLLELARLFVRRYRTTALVSAVSLALLLGALVTIAVSHRRTNQSLAEAFVEKARLAEAGLRWDDAAVWYAAALDQRPRVDATFGLRLAWERAGARDVTLLAAHRGGVKALAASPDGRWLASGGTDEIIRVWDLAKGTVARELAGHTNAITGLAFGPDGALYSVSDDHTTRRWAPGATAAEVLATLTDSLNAVALSPDGKSLAVGCETGELFLLDPATGARQRVMGRRGRPIYAVHFSADGTELASGNWAGETQRWRVSDGAELEVLQRHGGPVLALAFSPAGQLASAGRDTAILVVALGGEAPEPVKLLAGHTQKIYGLAWSSDGAYLASAGSDGTLRVWGGATGAPLRGLSLGQENELAAVVFVPGTHTVAWAGTEGRIALRTLPPVEAVPPPWEIQGLSQSPDGHLFMPLHYGFAEVDPATGLQTRHTAGGEPSSRLAVSHAGVLLVGRSGTDMLGWWDLSGNRLLGRVRANHGILEGLAFSPGDRLLATVGRDSKVRVWDVAARRELKTISAHHGEGTNGVAFSPDGRLLATSGYDKEIALWETAGFTEVRRLLGHEHGVRRVVFSPDGKQLASASWDRTVRVWDVATGRELARLRHQDFVFGVEYRADGRVLATGSHDGTVRLWDTVTWREELRFLSDEARVSAVSFGPGGRSLFYAGRALHRIDLESDRPLPTLGEVLAATGKRLDGVTLSSVPRAPPSPVAEGR